MKLNPLQWAAKQGRLMLVAGLLAGIALPQLAVIIHNYIGILITLLLFLNAFLIGPRATLGTVSQIKFSMAMVIILQIFIPCFLVLIFNLFKITGPVATALILITSAASISGSYNITKLLGHNPVASQRLMILGTGLLPLTILPVFSLLPDLGGPGLVMSTALRLFAVIVISCGIGYGLRVFLFKDLSSKQSESIDGLSVIVMSLVVIGLMTALGPTLFSNPISVFKMLLIVFAINYALQIICYLCLGSKHFSTDRVGISVVAGNRNIALFLTALPANVTEPVLLFIACYQLPMYLTPILMKRFYKVIDKSTTPLQ